MSKFTFNDPDVGVIGELSRFTICVEQPKPIASVSKDGEVSIDWAEVERASLDKANTNWAYARIFAAIRNGDWKPLETK